MLPGVSLDAALILSMMVALKCDRYEAIWTQLPSRTRLLGKGVIYLQVCRETWVATEVRFHFIRPISAQIVVRKPMNERLLVKLFRRHLKKNIYMSCTQTPRVLNNGNPSKAFELLPFGMSERRGQSILA